MDAVQIAEYKQDITVWEDLQIPKIHAVNIFPLNWLFLNQDRVIFSTKLSSM